MLSIDRIENDIAVCIDDEGNTFDLELNLIDDEVKEGDILIFKGGRYKVDEDKTKAEREEIEALQDELFES